MVGQAALAVALFSSEAVTLGRLELAAHRLVRGGAVRRVLLVRYCLFLVVLLRRLLALPSSSRFGFVVLVPPDPARVDRVGASVHHGLDVTDHVVYKPFPVRAHGVAVARVKQPGLQAVGGIIRCRRGLGYRQPDRDARGQSLQRACSWRRRCSRCSASTRRLRKYTVC